MINILKEKIEEIKLKEKSALIVLKGFSLDTFKHITNDFDIAFFEDFYKEKNVLYTLLQNRRKLRIQLLSLEEGIYIARYEEFMVIEKTLSLYENKVFILENNLFDYYLYEFEDIDDIKRLIKIRESEIVSSDEENIYEFFYSDIVENENSVYISFKNLNGFKEKDGPEIVSIKVFTYEPYFPGNIETIDIKSLDNVYIYSLNDSIKNEDLKYKILSKNIGNKLKVVLEKNISNQLKIKYELGKLKYLCEMNSVEIVFYQKEKHMQKEFRDEIKKILQKYWKSTDFRKLRFYKNPDISSEKITVSQGEIIEEVIEEVENSKENRCIYNNIFITAPTGAGKSIFFQIPAVYLEKRYKYITIVISPLKALMKDQVENLKQKGIKSACFLNSDLSFIEKNAYIEKIKNGEKSLVYLSPELLQSSSDITSIIGEREIGLVVIDEAHTVSTWGKNFRIDYLLIGNYVKKIELYKKYNFPILALTATAIYGGENDTVHEILSSLKIDARNIHIGEVRKDNIEFKINKFIPGEGSYNFLKIEKTKERIKEKLSKARKTIFYFPYAKHISEVYKSLGQNISSKIVSYTGKLDFDNRIESQNEFKTNNKKIMLATKAFGMGIDIPDIENIYHFGLSGDLSDYIQEIGRCARKKGMNGIAEIDFNKMDLKYPKILRGISGIKQWQMRLVIQKLFELYKLNNNRATFLLSIESFRHIFLEKEKELEKKVKQALIFLEKDLLEKYTFPVIIARPKAFFSSLYVVINKEKENEILIEKNKKFFIKVICQEKNTRMLKAYDFKGNENITYFYDTGDIYEFKISEYWEKYYDNISFPIFIRKFFRGEIFDNRFVSNRIRLKIELLFRTDEVLSELEFYLDIIFKSLRSIKGYFSKEELEEELKINLKYRNKNFIRRITNIILTYSFIASPMHQVTTNKFLRMKRDIEKNEDKYILVNGNFLRFKSSIIRNFIEMFDTEKTLFIKYLSKESKFLDVATLIQTLQLGIFEVTGGNTPKIFLRINDPSKLEYLANDNNYSNSVLSNIERRGKNADKILEEFFSLNMSNVERWDYIEKYFLGKL